MRLSVLNEFFFSWKFFNSFPMDSSPGSVNESLSPIEPVVFPIGNKRFHLVRSSCSTRSTDRWRSTFFRFDVEQWLTEANNTTPVTIYSQREDDLGQSMPASLFWYDIPVGLGWTYSVTVKTQAVLPAQTALQGKLILSIFGETTSLDDAVLASDTQMPAALHAGVEHLVELKSSQRLGEVVLQRISREATIDECLSE